MLYKPINSTKCTILEIFENLSCPIFDGLGLAGTFLPGPDLPKFFETPQCQNDLSNIPETLTEIYILSYLKLLHWFTSYGDAK